MKGLFYGIGVGPGDPELLTYKAVRILDEIDCVAVPVAERDRESTARRIAGPFIRPDCQVVEIDFPMIRDRLRLEEAWREGYSAIKAMLEAGRSVAFLTLGDPMIYSTYIYLYQRLHDDGFPVHTVPGITSFCAAAAAGGVPLAFGDDKVALLPGSAVEDLENGRLDDFQTVVIFKVASQFEKLVDALERAGRLESSLLVISCGHPEEKVITDLRSMVGSELSYFSLIISRKEPLR